MLKGPGSAGPFPALRAGPPSPTLIDAALEHQIADGVCTQGQVGHSCITDGDCVTDTCVVMYPGGPTGEEAGECTTGSVGAYCNDGSGCATGYCSKQPSDDGRNPNVGTCVTGEDRGPCFNDEACQSGLCILDVNNQQGICGTGEPGDFCHDAADCPVGTCQGTLGSMACSDPDGTPCDDGNGLCVGLSCHRRRCG